MILGSSSRSADIPPVPDATRTSMWQRFAMAIDVERVDFVSSELSDLARARAFDADVLGLPRDALDAR